MSGLAVALKEWAVICRALAEGRQALLLRKGDVAEPDGVFRVEHERFWLNPTYVHQQRSGVRSEALPLLEHAEAQQPPVGTVRVEHFAEVAGVWFANRPEPVLSLARFHFWSEETVRSRFAYRRPGLFVVAVRVWRAEQGVELAETVEYAGCKSWVELDRQLPTQGARRVAGDELLGELERQLASCSELGRV
jgi:hypothetical protein